MDITIHNATAFYILQRTMPVQLHCTCIGCIPVHSACGVLLLDPQAGMHPSRVFVCNSNVKHARWMDAENCTTTGDRIKRGYINFTYANITPLCRVLNCSPPLKLYLGLFRGKFHCTPVVRGKPKPKPKWS